MSQNYHTYGMQTPNDSKEPSISSSPSSSTFETPIEVTVPSQRYLTASLSTRSSSSIASFSSCPPLHPPPNSSLYNMPVSYHDGQQNYYSPYPLGSSATDWEDEHHPTPPHPSLSLPPPPPPPPPLTQGHMIKSHTRYQCWNPNNHPYLFPNLSQHAIKARSDGSKAGGGPIVKERRHRKQPHELLSESQKKANHIASEQKSRRNIRIGFDQLIDIVPCLNHGNRSEALILQKSGDHIRHLISLKNELESQVRDLQGTLGDTNFEEDESL